MDRVVAEAMDDGVDAGAVPGIEPFASRVPAETEPLPATPAPESIAA